MKQDMTISDFLELTNSDKYDFTNDTVSKEAHVKDYREINDAMEKFYVYFASKEKETAKCEGNNLMNDYQKDCKEVVDLYGEIGDPDSNSKLLQAIYKNLWDKKHLKDCREEGKGEEGKIFGETMNSANTTLDVWYAYLETEQHKQERKELRNPTQKKSAQRISKRYILSRYSKDKKGQKTLLGENCQNFLSLYHTLGNFIPVPVGCNAPRGIGILADYWDLTLKVIYDYYKGDDHIRDIIEKDNGDAEQRAERYAERYKKYRQWLDSFQETGDNGQESWNRFVEKNYMQDFVEPDLKGGYGMPKELWENHFSQFSSNPNGEAAKPMNKEQTQEFFANASALIIKRSNRMIQELKKNDIMMP